MGRCAQLVVFTYGLYACTYEHTYVRRCISTYTHTHIPLHIYSYSPRHTEQDLEMRRDPKERLPVEATTAWIREVTVTMRAPPHGSLLQLTCPTRVLLQCSGGYPKIIWRPKPSTIVESDQHPSLQLSLFLSRKIVNGLRWAL